MFGMFFSLLGDVRGVSMQMSPLSSAKAPLHLRQGTHPKTHQLLGALKVYGSQQAILSGHDMSI